MSPSDSRGIFGRGGKKVPTDFPPPWHLLREKLLSWYGEVARPLPWREKMTPYRVWVSEIMLQQTTVRTVIGYFDRFIRRYPDVESLAGASLEEVLKLWEGLGYYQRARNLHKAACQIVAEGKFPDTPEKWTRLPGIGRSTAGAICSIALGQETPILDANVRRVQRRLLGLPREGSKVDPRLWEASAGFVKNASDPGRVNQALMELGALVCLPRRPRCIDCPLTEDCVSSGESEETPARPKKPKAVRIRTALLPSDDSGVFLVQGKDRLLEGLWDVFSLAGPPPAEMVPVKKVVHEYTHFREEVHLVRAEIPLIESLASGQDCRWLPSHSPATVPLTGVARKILSFLEKPDGRGSVAWKR